MNTPSHGIFDVAARARRASQSVRACSAKQRSEVILQMADALAAARADIMDANARDVATATANARNAAFIDRLTLTPKRIHGMVTALQEIAQMNDPVGQVTQSWQRPNGLQVRKVRIPLGLIAMIYESRPNVTADAAALCLKSGNAVLLRGGSEALHSNAAIVRAIHTAMTSSSIVPAAVTLVEDLRREAMLQLVQLTDVVDLVIPRGGEALIRFVTEHARVPVIKHFKGVCHVFVDASADQDKALDILVDSKVSRPSACNACETLLIHRDIAQQFLPKALTVLRKHLVKVCGDSACQAIDSSIAPATPEDYSAEYLDLILAIRIVDDLADAIAHIGTYGSDHTEVIITANHAHIAAFADALPSAVVIANASSRFSDGGELGLGAEIGISTTRLHAYGPMGIESLTVERFFVEGQGQVRHPELLHF